MSTGKQQHKQTKRERKAAKEAARAEARRAESRRNRITVLTVVAIALVAVSLAGWMIIEDRREQQRIEEEQQAEIDRLEEQAAEVEEAIAEREVACGAEEPAAAAEEREPYEAPDDVLEEGVDYRARVATSCGELEADLHADAAPETVNSFVFLAEDGFFDGREVFRNDPGIEILQTGAGDDQNTWDIGYDVAAELGLAEEEGYPVGSLAMAHAGDPDGAGSQFFIVYGEAFEEVHGEAAQFTRFGDVVDGFGVLEEIAAVGTLGEGPGQPGYDVPAEVIYLEGVEILTDGPEG